jgi:putative ABC transport system permease protein
MGHLRFAFRMLAKSPGFTLAAIVTLALGIGSAATVFTAINALLLRPFPFIQHQERMLWVNEAIPSKDVDQTDIALADFLDWRTRNQTLEALWLYEDRTAIITGRSLPVRKLAAGISAGAFQAMGVQPILGRNFLPEDDVPGAAPVVILGHDYWRQDFGGNADVIGQPLMVNGQSATIVGVMPAGWRYPERADLWLPMRPNPAEAKRGHFAYSAHAMLKAGVSLDEARAEFATISAALAKEFPSTNEGLVAVLRPVREEAVQDVRELLVLLFGAVLFVFLIACANVANLLLARATVRTREIAIRLALGASRRQLVAQLLTESLLLSFLGGVAGWFVALWGVDLVVAAIPNELPFWMKFELDVRVLGFVAGLSLLASIAFGLVPAWQATRPDVVDEIKEGGRSASGGARAHRLRNALVTLEVATALVLLVGGGLMMRSFLALNRAHPGFDAANVLTFRVGFPPAMTGDKEVIRRFFADLLPRLAALPGCVAAAAVSAPPGLGYGGFNGIVREGESAPASLTSTENAMYRIITPDYFDTLRIPLRHGRGFAAGDDAAHPRVAIVDEVFVRRHFPDQAALGRRFRPINEHGENGEWLEIVGVVGMTRRFFDRENNAGTYYVPHAQNPSNFMSIVMRVNGDPAAWLPGSRETLLDINKDIPLYNEGSLARAIAQSDAVFLRRFFGSLFIAFAAVALVLASVGIYAVISYSVSQRTQEIGVRMALGAQSRDVVIMVVAQGLRLIGLGLGLGFVAAYFTARLLAGTLYEVSPHDPPTFVAVPLLLALVALLACYFPSRRATLINPIVALRAE